MTISPPRPKGPPLNALRAFEAAARLGGFAVAAEELNVTPGAVAQHIKALETWAGAPLFERRSQGVRLTILGSEISQDFSEAFDSLGEAIQSLRGRAAPHQLHIAVLPSIAQLWLSPRLPALRRALPGVVLSVTAMETPPNLLREPYDLSLFFAGPEISGTQVSLGRDVIFPVCAPSLAKDIKKPSDLAKLPLLHDTFWRGDWEAWVSSAKIERPLKASFPSQDSVFSLYSLAVQEAENGAGVLMGHAALVEDRLKTGALVAPLDHQAPLDRHLVLECARHPKDNHILKEVIQGLTDQAQTP
ncbi:MAG: LysR substrate-binding domain-containing protein [Pseudomonadota bacterium]